MLKFLNKPVAGTSSCGAMEAETIQKNAVSPKNQRSRGNIVKKTVLFFTFFCLFQFGFVCKIQSQLFAFDGIINDKDYSVGFIDLRKDSLLIVLSTTKEIGAKHKIKEISIEDGSIVKFRLDDAFLPGQFNMLAVFSKLNCIFYGTENDEEDAILIENLGDLDNNDFPFAELLVAAKKRISSSRTQVTSTTSKPLVGRSFQLRPLKSKAPALQPKQELRFFKMTVYILPATKRAFVNKGLSNQKYYG